MDLGIPPLNLKNLLELNPTNSRLLVCGLAAADSEARAGRAEVAERAVDLGVSALAGPVLHKLQMLVWGIISRESDSGCETIEGVVMAAAEVNRQRCTCSSHVLSKPHGSLPPVGGLGRRRHCCSPSCA